MDALLAGFDRQPRAALRHVERVGDPDNPGLQGVGLASAAMTDDRVQDLGGDDRPLGLTIGIGEQTFKCATGQEEAVGLVVLPVDRHPDVMQERAAGDDHLGIFRGHAVIGHDHGLDARLDQQPQQPQGDVEHDLHVDPRVVRHPQALGVDLGHVPPGPHLLVPVDGLQEARELAVAPGGARTFCLGNRLAGAACDEGP